MKKTGNNPTGEVEPAGNPGGRSSRKTRFLLGIGIVVLAVSLCEFWGIGAICPKCLQAADIHLIKMAGIPVFKWTSYRRHMQLSPSWSAHTFSVPNDIHPGMYSEILGKKCKHGLKKDGFSATIPPFSFLGAHKDGTFSGRQLYQPRIKAVATLYSVFASLPNGPLARMTYARIDCVLPMDKEDRLWEVDGIRRMLESGSASEQELEQRYPEAFPMFQAIEKLKVFTARLAGVESEEQWANLLRDLDEQPERLGQ